MPGDAVQLGNATMKKLLFAATILAGSYLPALGATTDTFCGPSSGMGCENGSDLMVFLQDATGTMHGFGNIGGQTMLPIMDINSDGGMMSLLIDLKNGFATIKPTNGISFNGVDITIPGFTFTQLVFDTQLTPVAGQSTDSFTTEGFTGNHISAGINTFMEAADTDKEYSITAVGGAFDEVNIAALTGFDEIKHIEVEGLAPVIVVPVAEPKGIAIMGLGLLALGVIQAKRRWS
jgi:hypothetical protein